MDDRKRDIARFYRETCSFDFSFFFFSLHRIAELIGVTADQLWRISELLKFVLKISKLLKHLSSLRIFRVIIIRRNL